MLEDMNWGVRSTVCVSLLEGRVSPAERCPAVTQLSTNRLFIRSLLPRGSLSSLEFSKDTQARSARAGGGWRGRWRWMNQKGTA